MVDDNFLYLALKQQGNWKDLEAVRDNWLPRKQLNEIKHRIKNLTCLRAQDNIIKQWKLEFNLPLRQGLITKDTAYGIK